MNKRLRAMDVRARTVVRIFHGVSQQVKAFATQLETKRVGNQYIPMLEPRWGFFYALFFLYQDLKPLIIKSTSNIELSF